MTLRHPAVEEFERRLHGVLGQIDRVLEAEFGPRVHRDPRRPPVGSTADHSADGLFRLSAAFGVGYGSEYGPGYIVEIGVRSARSLPADLLQNIEERAILLLCRELAREFPARALRVVRDGPVWKIVGDLSLGRA